MKVCFVTANYPPEAWGGTEQVVSALANDLRAKGLEIVVVSGSDLAHGSGESGGQDVRSESHEGVVVHRFFKRADEWDRHGFVRPRLLALVRTLLERERPDVVHVHSMASLGAGGAAICRDLGIPFAMTFHDLWVTCARYFRLPAGGVKCPTGIDRTPCVTCVNDALQQAPQSVAKALVERDRLLRAEVALAAACTAPSETAARFVRDCLPYEGGIEVIPHGLLRAVAPAQRAAPPATGELLRVGSFGGLVREKGIVELVDALVGLPCELRLSGRVYDGDVLHHVHRHERKGMKVVCRNAYTPAERHPARDLHLAVFPSKCQETYGLVVDEALAHGVPVVVSDQGALAERAGTPGVVVTPLAGLAKVLRELVGSPARLAAQRAAIPAELPTIAISAQRHLDLYRRLR
ncbi:MAG: glycosyltransferase [Planctomycetota bacterium]